MSKKIIIIIGIVAIVGVIGGFVYCYKLTLPNDSEIQAVTKVITQVNKIVLSDKAFQTIKSLNMNGDLPLTVNPSSVGKSNPF